MAGVFGDYSQLFRLFHASVIKRFVRRENPEREFQLKKKKFSDTSGEEDSMFVAETASLLDLFPELSKEGTEVFKTSFHDFSVNCGIPIAAILVSKQENCRMCKKPLLLLDNEWKKTVWNGLPWNWFLVIFRRYGCGIVFDTAMRKPLNSWSSCIFHIC